MRSIRPWAGAFAVAVLTAALPACGSREVVYPTTGNSLTGTVKYGSEQLQFALILVMQENAGSTGMIRDDGTYFVDNVPLGEVSIAVIPDAARGVFMQKSMAAGAYAGPEAKGGSRKVPVKFIGVPDKFTQVETSGIKTTVQKASATALTSGPERN
jgi:hypothetical protein